MIFHNNIKLAAGMMAMTLVFTGNGITAHAANITDVLPAAGLGLSLEEGLSLQTVTDATLNIVEPAKVVPLTAEQKEQKTFYNLVIAQVNSFVNVRGTASEDGEIVGKLYDKSVGTYSGEENGWYRIKSGNCEGYVKAEYCVTGEEAIELAKKVGTRVATVNPADGLNVRKEPGTDAPIMGQVPQNEELIVTEEADGWVKVKIEEGSGYVSGEYVTLRTDFVQAESKEEEDARLAKEAAKRAEALAAARKAQEAEAAAAAARQAEATLAAEETVIIASAESTELGQQVADYALQFVGNPYVYGGTSLTNGADCSGFVLSVYANFGVSLPHSASADRKQGYDAGGIGGAQAGDLVCYSGHVGIYIGDGQIVHASNSRTGIITSNANYDTILAVRRIF